VSTLRAAVAGLPGAPGVYRFRDATGRALYIGRATHLRSRVASYWGDLRDRPRLRRMVVQVARIEAVVCASVHEAAWLERNLLEQAKPRWNRVRGGLEVPVCVRLDPVSGLTVEHWPAAGSAATDFGPYLGGTRARLAVSALDRVLPLRYARTGLDGGMRDMARIRGVAVADRTGFLATITAVLNRQPEEVALLRDQLAEQRDRAAERLAFETAARIRDEIAAVEWIVAEQKVTRLAPGPDHDVAGWSDGLLVRFRVRGGRLTRWEQQPSSYAEARRLLSRTPTEWTDFATHNAELARRLLG
jgi:excinuclease ABC subunit C